MLSRDMKFEWGCAPNRTLPWTITSSVDVPFGKVEIVQYIAGTARNIALVPRDHVLEMLIMQRSVRIDRSGIFHKVGVAHPMGDMVFFPENHAIVMQYSAAGPVRAIRCHYKIADINRHFSQVELVAGLAIKCPALAAAVHSLAKEQVRPGFKSSLLTESLAIQVGVELGRYLRQDPGAVVAGQLTQAQMAVIDARIDNLTSAILVEELAALCRLSRRHFFRLFRQTTGMAPVAYITARQIARAKDMLEAPDAVTKRIAHDCGFRTASAFSAAFRREVGMTPRAFQRLSGRRRDAA
jgi:AraC family transcriptional regulator